ncbi:MAG TPA: hypothetical protein VF170_18410, partial [Planctomycetaceae bacterium]
KVRGGRTYREAVLIDNRDFSFPKRVRLVSDGPEPATLAPDGNGPAVRLVSVERFEIEGFRLDAGGRAAAIELGSYLSGTKLRNLVIDGATGTGVLGLGPAGGFGNERLTVENVTVRGAGGEAVGVRLTGGESTATGHVLLRGLRLLGPMSAGLVIDDVASDIELRESVLSEAGDGVRIAGSPRLRDLVVRNNTFFRTGRGIVFEAMPESGSDGFAFRRNIFAESATADAVVERGFDFDAFTRMLTTQGAPIEHNLTTRPEPAENGIDLFSSRGRRGAELAFVSTDPSQPAFLVPTSASAAAKAGGGQGPDGYAGALPPQ